MYIIADLRTESQTIKDWSSSLSQLELLSIALHMLTKKLALSESIFFPAVAEKMKAIEINVLGEFLWNRVLFVSTAVIVTSWTCAAEGTEAMFAGLGGQAALSAPPFPSVHWDLEKNPSISGCLDAGSYHNGKTINKDELSQWNWSHNEHTNQYRERQSAESNFK